MIEIHLKRGVDFFKIPALLIVVVGINIVGRAVYGE